MRLRNTKVVLLPRMEMDFAQRVAALGVRLQDELNGKADFEESEPVYAWWQRILLFVLPWLHLRPIRTGWYLIYLWREIEPGVRVRRLVFTLEKPYRTRGVVRCEAHGLGEASAVRDALRQLHAAYPRFRFSCASFKHELITLSRAA